MAEKLADVLGGMDFGVGGAIKICGLLALWPDVVDEKVCRNTEAVKINNKVLYVSTTSPAWAQELTFLKIAIIKKFNDLAGKEVIVDIKFSPRLV
ncbi:MAG: DUF721 domain-containing protein [bacterium]|nr:DUF721 domain-containing protein [Candidatus Margulisiibacteriota bacterium]